MSQTILMMTATIAPPAGAPGVKRMDPAVRMDDYLDALRYYTGFVGRGIDAICFAENSAADPAPLVDLAASAGVADRVWFSDPNDMAFPPEYGRCYGELALLERAMDDPRIAALPADTVFWKVTGRYRLLNLCQMIASRPAGCDFYSDLRKRGEQCWADLRVMSWTRRGFDQVLRGMAPDLREDTRNHLPGEEAAYVEIGRRVAERSVKARLSFVREPYVNGIRAFDEQNWAEGRQKLVYWSRSLQRWALGRVLV